jgi:hypothetical protein
MISGKNDTESWRAMPCSGFASSTESTKTTMKMPAPRPAKPLRWGITKR